MHVGAPSLPRLTAVVLRSGMIGSTPCCVAGVVHGSHVIAHVERGSLRSESASGNLPRSRLGLPARARDRAGPTPLPARSGLRLMLMMARESRRALGISRCRRRLISSLRTAATFCCGPLSQVGTTTPSCALTCGKGYSSEKRSSMPIFCCELVDGSDRSTFARVHPCQSASST
jgi:hypothetical protein